MKATFNYIAKDGTRGIYEFPFGGGYWGWLTTEADLLCQRLGWYRTSPVRVS